MPDDSTSAAFRSRLLAGEKLIGTMVTLPSPAVAEIMAQIGFDWLFLDGEHAPLETSELLSILQAVGNRIACIVRVPSSEDVPIRKALDLGAAGIIVPQVNTAEQAERVVRACRYPPQGERGVGLARAHGYGLCFQPYMASANEQTTIIVQAEHIRAVENIEHIVAVPGIDAVLVGPYDLSASLGRTGEVDHPEVTDAIGRVTNACRKAGVQLGIFGVSAAAVRPALERGYTLIVAGVDTLMLGLTAQALLRELR